jgi:outer membrane beta-barrel protein
MKNLFLSTLALFIVSSLPAAFAQEGERPSSRAGTPAKVDLKMLQDKIQNLSDPAEFRVVQNRAFTRTGKVEFMFAAYSLSSDPFLSVKGLGGSVNFYFSEFIGVEGFYHKYFTEYSSAHTTLIEVSDRVANTNFYNSNMGAGLIVTPLYGKLSLFGSKILYYDLFGFFGVSLPNTQTGTYFAPTIGLTQQVHVSKTFSIRFDYRLMYFKENIPRKNYSPATGEITTDLDDIVVQGRTNFTNSISLGIVIGFDVL